MRMLSARVYIPMWFYIATIRKTLLFSLSSLFGFTNYVFTTMSDTRSKALSKGRRKQESAVRIREMKRMRMDAPGRADDVPGSLLSDAWSSWRCSRLSLLSDARSSWWRSRLSLLSDARSSRWCSRLSLLSDAQSSWRHSRLSFLYDARSSRRRSRLSLLSDASDFRTYGGATFCSRSKWTLSSFSIVTWYKVPEKEHSTCGRSTPWQWPGW